MDLTSCDKCGTVFNRNVMNFPGEIFDEEEGSYNERLCVWGDSSESFIAFLLCPVCKKGKILEENDEWSAS